MGQMIEFQRPDGEHSAGYLAQATDAGATGPGLILIQEWWGLNDNIRAIADRYAEAGFTTLAPDLYRGRCTTKADEASHLKQSLDFADATHQDLAGALQYLLARCGKVGVTGFCMGGALTLAAAAHLPGLAAASCFYGLPPAALADPAQIRIPVQGHFADQDDWCTPAAAKALDAALTCPHEIHHYPGHHGFFNSTRPEVFDAASAELAWQRCLGFWARYLATD